MNKGRDYYRQKQAETRRPKNLAYRLRQGTLGKKDEDPSNHRKVEVASDGTTYERDRNGTLRRIGKMRPK